MVFGKVFGWGAACRFWRQFRSQRWAVHEIIFLLSIMLFFSLKVVHVLSFWHKLVWQKIFQILTRYTINLSLDTVHKVITEFFVRLVIHVLELHFILFLQIDLRCWLRLLNDIFVKSNLIFILWNFTVSVSIIGLFPILVSNTNHGWRLFCTNFILMFTFEPDPLLSSIHIDQTKLKIINLTFLIKVNLFKYQSEICQCQINTSITHTLDKLSEINGPIKVLVKLSERLSESFEFLCESVICKLKQPINSVCLFFSLAYTWDHILHRCKIWRLVTETFKCLGTSLDDVKDIFEVFVD